jgi:hypothetical protein
LSDCSLDINKDQDDSDFKEEKKDKNFKRKIMEIMKCPHKN